MIDNALEKLAEFNIADASVHVWIFKKRINSEAKRPIYTGRWVESTLQVDESLKGVLLGYLDRITEILPYDLMAQNTEASALHLPTERTFADLILEQCEEQTDQKKIEQVRHINNALFYVVKFVFEEEVVFAVKQTDANWKTRRKSGFIQAAFKDDELDLLEEETFQIARDFDFLIHGEDVVARNKTKFESVLNYKEAHVENFEEIKDEQEFLDVFSDLAAIEEYVGSNKMQLRRVAAIRQKGYYKDARFIESLKDNKDRFRLNIEFDDKGKIVPTAETCRDIFQALLDHRLISHYNHVYDVQSTVQV